MNVSVIIPVYNGKKFVRQAINSALQQKEVLEIIVIDDGSTDGTLEMLTSTYQEVDKILILDHGTKENKGPASTRNKGILNSKGNLISFLDADDHYIRNRFKRTIETFNLHPDLDAYYEPALNISLENKYNKYYKDYYPRIDDKYYLTFLNDDTGSKPLDRWFSDGGFYGIYCLTIKREAILELGGFDEFLLFCEDTDLHYRIASKLKVSFDTNIANAKTIRRWHAENMSWQKDKKAPFRRYLFNKHKHLISQFEKDVSKINFLKKYLLAGRSSRFKALRYLLYISRAINLFLSYPKKTLNSVLLYIKTRWEKQNGRIAK